MQGHRSRAGSAVASRVWSAWRDHRAAGVRVLRRDVRRGDSWRGEAALHASTQGVAGGGAVRHPSAHRAAGRAGAGSAGDVRSRAEHREAVLLLRSGGHAAQARQGRHLVAPGGQPWRSWFADHAAGLRALPAVPMTLTAAETELWGSSNDWSSAITGAS